MDFVLLLLRTLRWHHEPPLVKVLAFLDPSISRLLDLLLREVILHEIARLDLYLLL